MTKVLWILFMASILSLGQMSPFVAVTNAQSNINNLNLRIANKIESTFKHYLMI